MKRNTKWMARLVLCAVVIASLPLTQTTAAAKERDEVIASLEDGNRNFLKNFDKPAETNLTLKLGWVREDDTYDSDEADSYVITSFAINGNRCSGTITVPEAGWSDYTEIEADLPLTQEQMDEAGISGISEIRTFSGRVEGYRGDRRVSYDSFYARIK